MTHDDWQERIDALIAECLLEAERAGDRTHVTTPVQPELVPLDLEEVTALLQGFIPRTADDGYMRATPHQIALDASIRLKLLLAERKLSNA